MMDNNTLPEKQIIAAEMIAAGDCHGDILNEIGVSERTLTRWKAQDDFKAAVKKFKDASFAAALTEIVKSPRPSKMKREREIENAQLEKMDVLIERLFELSTQIIDDCDPQELSPRMLPSLLKSLSGLIATRRSGSDRTLGLKEVIKNLDEGKFL